MHISFLESIKYVGHLWPLALLRFFISGQYFRMVRHHLDSDYLNHPYLSEQLRLKIEGLSTISFYVDFWNVAVQNNWLVMSHLIVGLEVIICVSYLLGFLVRPIALLAAFASLHMYWLTSIGNDKTYLLLFVVHMLFFFIGAGRCLGLDYHFFKSRRGLTW